MEINYIEKESKMQNLKEEEDENQLGNRFESLPEDSVHDILSRLPIKSIMQFTFVNKAFHSLWRNPDLARMHHSRIAKKDPFLIFHCNNPLSNQLHFVDLPDQDENMEKVRRFQLPFSNLMAEFTVVGSCEGILCLANSLSNDIECLYNPFTRQYKELPRSVEFPDQEVAYGFGFHPITKEYKVIKIIYYSNNNSVNNWRDIGRNAYSVKVMAKSGEFIRRRYDRSEVQVMSLSENKWRSLGETPHFLDRKSIAALVNGRLHWERHRRAQLGGLIVSFDLLDEVFREVPIPASLDFGRGYGMDVAVLSGCLIAGVPALDSFDIWMMKEYDVRESWVKQFSIEVYSPPRSRRSNYLSLTCMAVLYRFQNGDILLHYKSRALVRYNPENKTFKELTFPGLPDFLITCVHYGSLNWI